MSRSRIDLIEPLDESSNESLSPKRNLLKVILGGSLFLGLSLGAHCGSEAVNASAVKDQQETLLGVKSFLEKNSAKLKSYSSLSPEAMAQQAGSINVILKELIKELKSAKGAADEIGKTSVRFNPIMFEELEISLELAIKKLGGGKVGRLNQGAAKMRQSQNGWGFYNRGVRNKGINPQSVMYMSHLINELKKTLRELNIAVGGLEKEEVSGCSNNYFVDRSIKNQFGDSHCHESNSSFCKGVDQLDSNSRYNLSKVRAISVQRELIAHDLLPKKSDDGNFGKRSKAAYSRSQQSASFKKAIAVCKK